MDVAGLGGRLRTEARATDQRRLVVLAGDRARGYEALDDLLDGADIDRRHTTLVGADADGATESPVDTEDGQDTPRGDDPADTNRTPLEIDEVAGETIPIARAGELLGTTKEAVVLDLHGELRPNAIGATVGAVDGGGLYVLLTPGFDEWPGRRDDFDDRMAAPPFRVGDVTENFRRRLIDTLRRDRGIAIVDLGGGSNDESGGVRIVDDGLTDPAPRIESGTDEAPTSFEQPMSFPDCAFDRCLTREQRRALLDLESLTDRRTAVVVQADRGRGKSSAVGLAAGSLAATGDDVLVTAPAVRNAREVLERSKEVLDDLGRLDPDSTAQDLLAEGGGRVRFRPPESAVEAVEGGAESSTPATRDGADGDLDDTPDVVVVDEAATLPVRRLAALLEADRIAFATTTYGYEGTGRGFTVRFRDRLDEASHEVIEVRPDEPIRYAAGDPVETWAFDALLLNAAPVPGQAIASATPSTVEYRRLRPEQLRSREHRLREVFGLLVLAHYRTEPNDLARLLDAPNLAIRALLEDGHVVAVALLAREGGLGESTRSEAFDGGRIRGNMLPDVLMSQLRDEEAGAPVGARVVRIATHPDVRNRGLGSTLLERVRAEAETGFPEWDDAPVPENAGDPNDAGGPPRKGLDWVGVGYGATPQLLRFWAANGYGTVHLSTTRNDRSGEYSALMLDPLSERGASLFDRTSRRFARRIGGVCAGPLEDADPDVLRAALAAVDDQAVPEPELTEWEWTVVASAAYGPGMADVAPEPFRTLAVHWLIDFPGDPRLDWNQQRLLVRAALQGQSWEEVAADLEYPSTGACMRAFGDAFEPIVDEYGQERTMEIRARYDTD